MMKSFYNDSAEDSSGSRQFGCNEAQPGKLRNYQIWRVVSKHGKRMMNSLKDGGNREKTNKMLTAGRLKSRKARNSQRINR